MSNTRMRTRSAVSALKKKKAKSVLGTFQLLPVDEQHNIFGPVNSHVFSSLRWRIFNLFIKTKSTIIFPNAATQGKVYNRKGFVFLISSVEYILFFFLHYLFSFCPSSILLMIISEKKLLPRAFWRLLFSPSTAYNVEQQKVFNILFLK